MTVSFNLCVSGSFFLFVSGCTLLGNHYISDEEKLALIEDAEKQYVQELSKDITLFKNVAFGLGLPLRKYLNEDQHIKGKRILDLGAGSGVLSLIALTRGAKKAVATEINPYAVANANYNAERFDFKDRMDVRLVSLEKQGAYSVIDPTEQFDIIVSNPPQGTEQPTTFYEYSYSDPKLAFLKSILIGLNAHLSPAGKGVFALYKRGLTLAYQVAKEHDLHVAIYLQTNNRNGTYYIVEITRQQEK